MKNKTLISLRVRKSDVNILLRLTRTWVRSRILHGRPSSHWETREFPHAPGFGRASSSLPGLSSCRTRWRCTGPPGSWRPSKSPGCYATWPSPRAQRRPCQSPARGWCSFLQIDTSVEESVSHPQKSCNSQFLYCGFLWDPFMHSGRLSGQISKRGSCPRHKRVFKAELQAAGQFNGSLIL